MRTLNSIIESLAEIIRLGASFDLTGLSFDIEVDDINDDLAYGRS